MNHLLRASLIMVASGASAFAQLVPPNSLPPPVSPPLLPRPAHDPASPALPPEPRVAQVASPVKPEQPEILPPESGLAVTPGHYVSGCLQLPIYGPRGPYTQAPSWPGGVIPYEYDGNVSPANRTLFDAAIAEVEGFCGVDFVPRQFFHGAWLHIQNSNGNNAPVGHALGTHVVNITSWTTHYTIVHELFHVLGVYHEQSRADRDGFVTINSGNICQTCCPDASGNPAPCDRNFQREDSSGTIGLYNFDSFMHYPRAAFSAGGDTITVQAPFGAVWQNRIGQSTHASFGDRCTAMYLYQPGWAKIARAGGINGTGTWSTPFNNFPDAYDAAPGGGDVILRPGYFAGPGRRNKPMRIHAPDGNVRIGQ